MPISFLDGIVLKVIIPAITLIGDFVTAMKSHQEGKDFTIIRLLSRGLWIHS